MTANPNLRYKVDWTRTDHECVKCAEISVFKNEYTDLYRCNYCGHEV